MSNRDTTPTPTIPVSSGICDSIIVLLEKCDSEQCKLISEIAKTREKELAGTEGENTVVEKVREIVNGCTDEKHLQKIAAICNTRIQQTKSTEMHVSEQLRRKKIAAQLAKIIPKAMKGIDEFYNGEDEVKYIVNVKNPTLRNAVAKFLKDQGHVIEAYSDGDIGIKLPEVTYTYEMVQQEFDKYNAENPIPQ
jgi:transcriptional regulator of heat shock response